MRIAGRQLREYVALFMIRYQRGNSHINFIIDMVRMTAYISMIKILFEGVGWVLPNWVILFVPALPVILYFLGWGDEKRGFMKWQIGYSTKELNPPMKKLIEDVEYIKEKIDNQH